MGELVEKRKPMDWLRMLRERNHRFIRYFSVTIPATPLYDFEDEREYLQSFREPDGVYRTCYSPSLLGSTTRYHPIPVRELPPPDAPCDDFPAHPARMRANRQTIMQLEWEEKQRQRQLEKERTADIDWNRYTERRENLRFAFLKAHQEGVPYTKAFEIIDRIIADEYGQGIIDSDWTALLPSEQTTLLEWIRSTSQPFDLEAT